MAMKIITYNADGKNYNDNDGNTDKNEDNDIEEMVELKIQDS